MIAAGFAFELASSAKAFTLAMAVAALAVGGAADMSSAAFRQSILLGETNDNVRGRLQGVFIVVVAGGPRIADFLHGAAAETIGPAAATWAGGAAVVLGVGLSALVFPKFRRFTAGGGA